jgi:hypothetical protein
VRRRRTGGEVYVFLILERVGPWMPCETPRSTDAGVQKPGYRPAVARYARQLASPGCDSGWRTAQLLHGAKDSRFTLQSWLGEKRKLY